MCRVNSYINEKFDYPLPRGLNCTCLWLYDRLATHLSGPPVIHAKAGDPPSPMSVVAGKTRRSFRYTLSLPHAVDMQQFNRCQMARSVL